MMKQMKLGAQCFHAIQSETDRNKARSQENNENLFYSVKLICDCAYHCSLTVTPKHSTVGVGDSRWDTF